jgi:NAD(P)-dependent dehydrogenase (short-subunit alcohol dehydrogenase family)
VRRPFIGSPDTDGARLEMETDYLGTLSMCRAFAPVLGANGGGGIVNIMSIVSFFTNPFFGSYAASQAAQRSLTNGIRVELARQRTLVVGFHASFVETDMTEGIGAPKISTESAARQVFDAVEADQVEVLGDERTRSVKAALPRDQEVIYPPLQASWDTAMKARADTG